MIRVRIFRASVSSVRERARATAYSVYMYLEMLRPIELIGPHIIPTDSAANCLSSYCT